MTNAVGAEQKPSKKLQANSQGAGQNGRIHQEENHEARPMGRTGLEGDLEARDRG